MFELVTAIGQGVYCSRQAITYLTRYLVEAVKQKATQPLLAPYLRDILLRVALPLCFFTPALHAQWTDDPTEVRLLMAPRCACVIMWASVSV
jgi:hypothetical protein